MRVPLVRRPRVLAGLLAVGVGVAAVSIAVALLVTPTQQVTAAGQTVGVGASSPSLSLSGPGELDLFGQHLPTAVHFAGPIRPRLVLTKVTLNAQVASLFAVRHRGGSVQALGQALAAGWTRYFLWETVIAGACALLLIGALAGWWRLRWRRTLLLVAVGVAFVEAINLGDVMVTAYSAPGKLAQVHSVEALVGRSARSPIPAVPGPPRTGVQAVVMGDSTAAGAGNPLPSHPSALDRACRRSTDTYAADLGAVNGWRVLNLACSSATVPAGLLGPQPLGTTTAPPQLAVAKQATNASVVIVSVGADDLRWSLLLQVCAAVKACNNRGATAYFQQRLAAFTPSYYQLLQQLAALPNHPRVLINLYYNPFDTTRHCLDHVGLTPGKERALVGMLHALNHVLAAGARASSFTAVRPSFAGHAICDPEPYVQGLTDPAPFHPTVAGELAIALADEQVLQHHGP